MSKAGIIMNIEIIRSIEFKVCNNCMFRVIKKERQKSNIKYSNSKHSKTVETAGESVPAVFCCKNLFLFSRGSDILKMNIKNTKKKGEK